ncbi:MAG TPA: flagellar hook capping FlgD N-terminal domain-containing protein [Planctomicrobium sp.]|nr:flagellar hook capping FlgD N-terminal domain-containing protein [Planctomicrobium sp.]
MAVASTGFNSQIGQQQFLQLMAAQLMYQNPMEPMAQEDMLGQLAQFSTLSGIESLNANFEELFKLQALTQGAGLIGKQVTYFSSLSQSNQVGLVEAASVKDGKLVITVNGEQIKIDDISKIGIPPATEA